MSMRPYKSLVLWTHLTVQSNLANVASLLWHGYKSLPPPSCEVNWSGAFMPVNIEHS